MLIHLWVQLLWSLLYSYTIMACAYFGKQSPLRLFFEARAQTDKTIMVSTKQLNLSALISTATKESEIGQVAQKQLSRHMSLHSPITSFCQAIYKEQKQFNCDICVLSRFLFCCPRSLAAELDWKINKPKIYSKYPACKATGQIYWLLKYWLAGLWYSIAFIYRWLLKAT